MVQSIGPRPHRSLDELAGSGRVLEAQAGSRDVITAPLRTRGDAEDQRWCLRPSATDPGRFHIANLKSGLCLVTSIRGASGEADVHHVHQAECRGADSELWRISHHLDDASATDPVGRGIGLRNVGDGLCLDIEEQRDSDGAAVSTRICRPMWSQGWWWFTADD